MKQSFENTPKLGLGIYTVPDVALLLKIPYFKANRWINEYWDLKLGAEFDSKYSWTDGKAKAVSFHTMIELYIFFQLSDVGVKTPIILEAHGILAKQFKTPFPFATSVILENMSTDGKKIFFQKNDEIINVDSAQQLNLKFIKLFFNKLEFDRKELASRLWPLGKKKSVVVDPSHQFGQPVIYGTNVQATTLFNLHQSGEPTEFIASIYDLKKKQIEDAIEYCQAA